MPFARFSEFFLTLRFRLMLWVTVVVFVLVTLSMVVIGQIVRASLLTEFDSLLRKDLIDIRKLVKEHGGDRAWLFEQLAAWVNENDEVGFVQLYEASGTLVWESKGSPRMPPVSADLEGASYFDHGSIRCVEGPIHSPRGGDAPADHFGKDWLVRAGLSRHSLDADISLLNRVMVLASACIFILTPLAALVLAARTTRPLQRIISTTDRLEPKKLDERLPVTGSGDELDQLSQTINGMVDRIATHLDRNREFIASAAHELRSPLAAIRSSVEVALNRPRANEEYAVLLEDVMEECGRLGNLVDRLLLLASGDAGQIQAGAQTTRLDKILCESVDMFQGVAENANIKLGLGPVAPAIVPGDEYHLRQVVRNLIDNALKFTPRAQSVRVELETAPARHRALLRVIDEGCGIAPQDLPRIFDRFYRGDKARQRGKDQSGIGLGLSICQTIVESLHGAIRVESQVGKGTTFTVELPLANGRQGA